MVVLLGGMTDITSNAAALKFTWASIGITIISWLYGPFLFNPYQFSLTPVTEDLASWMAFFWGNAGEHWVDWYRYTQLFKRGGFRDAISAQLTWVRNDIVPFLFLVLEFNTQ